MSTEQQPNGRPSIISTDRPITSAGQDRFQREGFANRIVSLIAHRGKSDCLVIGLYGAWGDGKTSVIRMIEVALNEQKLATPFRFNPWVFPDEPALLRDFFHGLATVIDKNLKKGHEKLGDLIKKYSDVLSNDLPYLGKAVEVAKDLANTLSDTTAAELKTRLEAGLREQAKPIVVFIDDVDRLDKNEVHAIFRLVKLTGDLPNVTYILCFDDERVAEAIGERFGAGGKEAGRDFLEKVIQVPLRLPEIPMLGESGLAEYALERLAEACNACAADLAEEDIARFRQGFDAGVRPVLKTPRDAVRFANTVSFTIPMLIGEVDIADLMLFEALKLFYPNLYALVCSERHLFCDHPIRLDNHTGEQKVTEALNDRVKAASNAVGEHGRAAGLALIHHLFPRTATHYALGAWAKDRLAGKRVASPDYFQRYVTYAVIKGQLSDVEFGQFLAALGSASVEDATDAITRMVAASSAKQLLSRLEAHARKMPLEDCIKACNALACCADSFPDRFDFLNLWFDSPLYEAARFIWQCLDRIPDGAEKIDTLKTLVEKAGSLEFAWEIARWGSSNEPGKDRFPPGDRAAVYGLWRRRAMAEVGGKPVFVALPRLGSVALSIWVKEDAKEVREYVHGVLAKEPRFVLDLLRTATPLIRSSGHKEAYYENVTAEVYATMLRYADAEVIMQAFEQTFSSDALGAEEVLWLDHEPGQTDVNMVRQFLFQHQKQTKP